MVGLDEVHVSKEMECFLGALEIPVSNSNGNNTPQLDDDMTLENYIEAFNKTKEFTASFPPGIHYGHYKTACESEILSQVNLICMVIYLKVRLPSTRWTRSLHCMIQR